jgi:hypothetical protein
MANYAAMRFLEVWYSRIEVDEVSKMFDAVQPKAAARQRRRDIAKAGRRTSLRAMLKLCDQDFAIAYANQTEQDYQRLLEAVSIGRVLATVEQ